MNSRTRVTLMVTWTTGAGQLGMVNLSSKLLIPICNTLPDRRHEDMRPRYKVQIAIHHRFKVMVKLEL